MSSRPNLPISSDLTFHVLSVRHMMHKCIPSTMNKYNCTPVRYHVNAQELLRITRSTQNFSKTLRCLSIHSITLPDCSMPPMEADTTYQGCLPSCKLHMHSRSLTVRCTSKVERLYIAHSNHTIFRLHMCTNKSYCRSCVSCGGAPTPSGTSMFTI